MPVLPSIGMPRSTLGGLVARGGRGRAARASPLSGRVSTRPAQQRSRLLKRCSSASVADSRAQASSCERSSSVAAAWQGGVRGRPLASMAAQASHGQVGRSDGHGCRVHRSSAMESPAPASQRLASARRRVASTSSDAPACTLAVTAARASSADRDGARHGSLPRRQSVMARLLGLLREAGERSWRLSPRRPDAHRLGMSGRLRELSR